MMPFENGSKWVRIEPQRIVAQVTLPPESGLVGGLIGIEVEADTFSQRLDIDPPDEVDRFKALQDRLA